LERDRGVRDTTEWSTTRDDTREWSVMGDDTREWSVVGDDTGEWSVMGDASSRSFLQLDEAFSDGVASQEMERSTGSLDSLR
jgi:hypothetical protein